MLWEGRINSNGVDLDRFQPLRGSSAFIFASEWIKKSKYYTVQYIWRLWMNCAIRNYCHLNICNQRHDFCVERCFLLPRWYFQDKCSYVKLGWMEWGKCSAVCRYTQRYRKRPHLRKTNLVHLLRRIGVLTVSVAERERESYWVESYKIWEESSDVHLHLHRAEAIGQVALDCFSS